MKIVENLVSSFIKNNFSHERSDKRDMILESITTAMAQEFTEDNIATRYSALIQWIIANDKQFQTMVDPEKNDGHDTFRETMARVLSDAVLEKD